MNELIKSYYAHPIVKKRIQEFIGIDLSENSSCVYLSRGDQWPVGEAFIKNPKEINYFLDNGYDLFRSLWDLDGLIVDLDVEYVNFDFPAEPYLDPVRTFVIQQPVIQSIKRNLLHYGVHPLHILSGRGHHFLWKVSGRSQCFGSLQKIGILPKHLKDYYSKIRMPEGASIDAGLGAAFSGLGKLVEFIAFKVKKECQLLTEIPVEMTAVETSPQKRGREMISLDISEYGDPLNTRMVRIPFTAYLKPWFRFGILNEELKKTVQMMYLIPLHEINYLQGIKLMRNQQKVIDLATIASVQIPDQSFQTNNLLNDYLESPHYLFHQWFYSTDHDLPESWAQTYDKLDLNSMPSCVKTMLKYPNDRLLKPGGMRLLVRTLTALGWHPRHIAGLMRSKFERDYGWGNKWYVFDAATRADFYARIFSGLIHLDLDDFKDFTCEDIRNAHICNETCSCCNLSAFKEKLLNKGMKNV